MTIDRRTALLLAGSALAATAAGPALAALLARPTGDVILTVTGAVTSPNIPEGAAFDLTMLDALPQYETATETPWHDGMIRFQGPLIADVLAAAGADGSLLRVIALNDYAADIPIEDIRTYPVILASRINGEPIAVRNKGPLFVIYPFDRHPELVNELFFSRSVWQVKAINVSG